MYHLSLMKTANKTLIQFLKMQMVVFNIHRVVNQKMSVVKKNKRIEYSDILENACVCIFMDIHETN